VWLPLSEQEDIADFIDCKTAQIDTLIEKKQRQIELLQEQRTALINHAVTKGLNPETPMKDSGLEWLGEIPSHWRTAKAKQVSYIFVPQRKKPELNQDGDGLPWITTEDLTSVKIGKSSKDYSVSHSAALESGSKSLPAGSVIASCVGRFGVSSVSDCELIINQQLQAYIPHNINPFFLHYYITVSKNYFERVATASTLPYVNRENFGMLPVVLPPPEEQHEIVSHIERQNLQTDRTVTSFERQIEHLKEYRTALISEAVTGKIDVRS
jgi:type I restriction enzyme S subunit